MFSYAIHHPYAHRLESVRERNDTVSGLFAKSAKHHLFHSNVAMAIALKTPFSGCNLSVPTDSVVSVRLCTDWYMCLSCSPYLIGRCVGMREENIWYRLTDNCATSFHRCLFLLTRVVHRQFLDRHLLSVFSFASFNFALWVASLQENKLHVHWSEIVKQVASRNLEPRFENEFISFIFYHNWRDNISLLLMFKLKKSTLDFCCCC